MNKILDNLSWHTPVIDTAWSLFEVAGVTALAAVMFGGLCRLAFGNRFWRAGALLALILWVSLILLHAKWALLFLVAVGITATVFWYEEKQRRAITCDESTNAMGDPSRGSSPEVSR